jgi:serine/threonine protein kinase
VELIERISHYRILSKLGAGGMGEVYLAEDTLLDRKVAIKFLSRSDPNEKSKKRLVREAKTAAKLDHPNICSVYEVSEEGDQSFIVMQYIEGETLADRLKRKAFRNQRIFRYRSTNFESACRSSLARNYSSRHQVKQHHDHKKWSGENDGFWISEMD